jgi:RimJ/RimL family protein N-acetyltransferase
VILYGADDTICRWVSNGLFNNENAYPDCKALGILRSGQLIAGVVFSNYQEDIYLKPLSIEMTIFSVDKKWCTRHNLINIFSYPFAQLRLERVQANCSAHNKGVIMFLKRIGFTEEGYHRKAYADGGDALSFGMLKDECKWVNHNG